MSERLDSNYHDIDVSNFDDVLISETVAKHIAYKFAVCAGESISQSQEIFQKVATHITDKTTEEKMKILRKYREIQYLKLQEAVYRKRGWNAFGRPASAGPS